MIIYLVIIFQILAIVIFFERMMNGNIMILKDKYNLLTVELNELMKKSSFLEDEKKQFKQRKQHISTIYEIGKSLVRYMSKEDIVSLLKDQLRHNGIVFDRVNLQEGLSGSAYSKDREVFPLIAQDKKIGYLVFEGLDKDYVNDVTMLAKRLALSIRRFKLYRNVQHLAITDSLTRTLSRSYCLERLDKELGRAKRLGFSLSVAMVDLDNFKTYNDKYGHISGDKILKELSFIMKQALRNVDFIGRYGGEEFLIVMPEADYKGARFALERIRSQIASHVIDFFEDRVNLTISVGVATFPVDSQDFSELIEQADKALYRSKKSGKNKVTFFGL
ncbi:MAG: GGDEF domain-containing protein [Candidatus Gygaella obscura]|nr:GGDEF domain-containing protein [Candidatus Gygaella obscura]